MAIPFNFLWWNVYDFYHYDPDKVTKGSRSRWPASRRVYEEKCKKVDSALQALFLHVGSPQMLALAETTHRSASELRDRLLPGYQVCSLDVVDADPTLQVAILYKPNHYLHFVEAPPIVVPNTPRGTRPMAVVDVNTTDSEVRCIACHWQARLDDSSDRTRFRMADYLAQYVYDFLKVDTAKRRGVILLGDLNDEPFGDSLSALYAHRHRERAQKRSHWTDEDVKRVHLYNTSWRLLGEKFPFPEPASGVVSQQGCAGTYYWEDKSSWANLDHIVVSGSMLTDELPRIDEAQVAIVSLPEFLTDGVPIKFSAEGGKFRGLSDHLPVVGQATL